MGIRTHPFTSQLLLIGKTKDGASRLRVSVPIKNYKFMTYKREVVYLRKMTLERYDGQVVELENLRISKGSSNGSYAPHYITIPVDDVVKYNFQPNEPVTVTVEWDE